jgi:hypothetical protein
VRHFEEATAQADPFTLPADCFPTYLNLHQHPRSRRKRHFLAALFDGCQEFKLDLR